MLHQRQDGGITTGANHLHGHQMWLKYGKERIGWNLHGPQIFRIFMMWLTVFLHGVHHSSHHHGGTTRKDWKYYLGYFYCHGDGCCNVRVSRKEEKIHDVHLCVSCGEMMMMMMLHQPTKKYYYVVRNI
jgi:hypothetical protein